MVFEILLDEKNDRKANSLERDTLESIVSLFDVYYDGIVPFNEIWLQLKDKTNGSINEYKKHEMETELYGTIYKNTLTRMLRDRFGAKDPKTRDSKIRSLFFDIEKVRNLFDNYAKENPTKISCYQKVSDSNDSNDSNREDLFDNFFSFDTLSLINIDENDIDHPHGNTLMNGNSSHNKDEINTKFANTVITVTAVTNENKLYEQTESNYNDGYKKQEQNFSAKEFVNKDIANSSPNSNYQYTKEDIDKFFESANGQEEEHILEESICRPLIGQHSYKPFFYYCKIDPKVENINLKSIEDHIRLKDPERHKAKLFELLQKEAEITQQQESEQDNIFE